MISCDYNGWNDPPEEEREWMDREPELSSGPEALSAPRVPEIALQYGAVAACGKTELVG
jgi:hypothetical protein